MPRNMDLTALRSFVAVAETGGVTRAAAQLHLTQSAVSMQLKRLEDSLGASLIDRSGRGVSLTSEGEQLAGFARRMLALNDQALDRMTGPGFEGELTLGAPHDIVYPHVPMVLRHFDREYPRVKVTLISSNTADLRRRFGRGEVDVILTTENETGPGGEVLDECPLVWVGAPGGGAWRARPLRLAFEKRCIFRGPTQAALDEAGTPWEMAVESESSRAIEASVSADLAVHVSLASNVAPMMEVIRHSCALPSLPSFRVNMYRTRGPSGALADQLAEHIRDAYRTNEERSNVANLAAAG